MYVTPELHQSIIGLGWAEDLPEGMIANCMHEVARKRNPAIPREVADSFAKYGVRFGIRPDLAFGISMLETDWWRFTGQALPEMNNPGGIKCGCNKTPPDPCMPGRAGPQFRVYPTIDAGIAHMMAHLYCYTHATDNVGARQYDSCWSSWYKEALNEVQGTPSDSILACYTFWRLGKFTQGLDVERAKTITAIAKEVESNKPNTPINEVINKVPWWGWTGGLAALLLLIGKEKRRQ